MSKEKQIHMEKNPYGEVHFAIGDGIPRPLTTIINCKDIILSQESIGVEVNVTEAFERTNTIIVNSVEFRKQSKNTFEVIRCKNCINRDETGICQKFRQRYPFYPEDNFYCGYGERR